jgi:tRNA dimethylallyltransferase
VSRPRLLALVGPTGAGKSDLALRLAERLDGEIVSCDSVQVYRGLDIGSGKPSAADRARVPHHLIDVRDLGGQFTAADFAREAAEAIGAILGRGRLPIACGGTGLYLTALLRGLFAQERAAEPERRRIQGWVERFGANRVHRVLRRVDPESAARVQPLDSVRVVRALEVRFATGRPMSERQRDRRPAFTGEVAILGLDPGRETLRRRVEARTRAMLAAGLIDESREILSTLADGVRPRSLASIGYKQAIETLDGTLEPSQIERVMVTATMQYAKRQMTYFRRQFAVEWFSEPDGLEARAIRWAAQEGRPE